jgi:hypothetical protein
MKIQEMLKSQNVLYAVIVLAILCASGFVCVSSYECLAILVITYFIACNYVKNKVICLLISVFVANFVFGCKASFKGIVLESFVGYKGTPGSLSHYAESIGNEVSNGIKKKVKEEVGKAVVKAKLEEGASSVTAVKAGKEAADKAGKEVGDEAEKITVKNIKENLTNMLLMEKNKKEKK